MFKKITALVLLLTLFASPALAQLNLTYTSFQPGQTISSAQFTANFTAISANALNRTGGIMTGTLTLSGGLDINGSFTIGSTNLQPFDSAGKVKEISSTYFDNLSGTNLTGVARLASNESIDGSWTFNSPPIMSGIFISAIPEANISDGAIFTRVNGTESITGAWTFTNTTIFNNNSLEVQGTIPRVSIYQSDAGTNEKYWLFLTDGNILNLTAYNDNLVGGGTALTFTRSGSGIASATMTATDITLAGNVLASGALFQTNNVLAGAITTVGATTVGGTLGVTGTTTVTNITVSGTLTAANFAPTTIAVGDGSVTGPTLTFAADLNTGFYRFADNTIGVAAAGTMSMTIGDVLIAIPDTRTVQVSNIRTVISGAGTIGTSSNLYNAVYALSHLTTSDRRAKMDIHNLDLGVEFIAKLQPVNYRFTKDPTKLRYGFIAQDLVELGFAGVDTSDPSNLTLNYSEFIAPIVKSIQQLHQEDVGTAMVIRMQDAKIQMLVERIIELEKGYGGKRIVE